MQIGCYQTTGHPLVWFDADCKRVFHEDLVAVHFDLGGWDRYDTPLHSIPLIGTGLAGTYFPFCKRICVLKNCYFSADSDADWEEGTAQWYAPMYSGTLAPEDDRPETVHPVVTSDMDIPPVVWQVFGSNAMSLNHSGSGKVGTRKISPFFQVDRRNKRGDDPANYRTGGTPVPDPFHPTKTSSWTGGTKYETYEELLVALGRTKKVPAWRKVSAPSADDSYDPDQVAEKIYAAYNAANMPDIVDCPHDVYLIVNKWKCRVRAPAEEGDRGMFDWGVRVNQAHAYFYVAGLEKA
jgi:hypothetical protein